MRIAKRRIRPLWVILMLLALCAITWAVSELSGQANKSAANAGASSADFEMASFETIKPAKDAPPCDWALEKKTRQEIEKIDADYKKLVTKAQGETNKSGEVSKATGKSLRDSAAKFKDACERYAKMWDACNCKSRAKLARETGASRVASAELIASGADSDKSKALQKQQDKLNQARQDYIKEAVANKELSDADKAQIKSNLLPQSVTLAKDVTGLVKEVTKLLDNVQSQAKKATSGSGLGSLTSSIGSAASADSPAALISPVTNLLNLSNSMLKNVNSLTNDLMLLSK